MRKMFSKKQIDGMILEGTEEEKSILKGLSVDSLFLGGEISIELSEVEYRIALSACKCIYTNGNDRRFYCQGVLVDWDNLEGHGIIGVDISLNVSTYALDMNIEYIYNPENLDTLPVEFSEYELLFLDKNKFIRKER